MSTDTIQEASHMSVGGTIAIATALLAVAFGLIMFRRSPEEPRGPTVGCMGAVRPK